MKEKYENVELEVIEFEEADIVMASLVEDDGID